MDLEWMEKSRPDKREMIPMMRRRFVGHVGAGDRRMMPFQRARITEVTLPRYNTQTGKETVTLISNLKNESGEVVGRLKVDVNFGYLMHAWKLLARESGGPVSGLIWIA